MCSKSAQHIHKQIFNETSIEPFRRRLWEIKWNNLLTSNDANLAYNELLETFTSLYEDCFPRMKIKVKAWIPFRSWATKGLLGKNKNCTKNI